MVKGVNLAVDKKITKVKCGKYCADFTDGGKIFDYDEGFISLTGYSPRQFDGGEVVFDDLIPRDEFDSYMEKVEKLRTVGGGALEHRLMCADGTVLDIICIGTDFTSAEGHSCVNVTVADNSDHAALKRKYESAEKEMDAIAESVSDGLVMVRIADGIPEMVKASDEYYRIIGMDKDSCCGMMDIIKGSDREKLLKNIDGCVKTKLLFEQDLPICRSGERAWLRLRARYLDPPEGEDGAMLYCAIADITENKMAEYRLKKQGYCMQMIADNTEEKFFEYNAERDELSITAGEQVMKQFGSNGIMRNFLSGRTADGLIHPDDIEVFYKTWENALASPQKGTADFRCLIKKGTYRWYRMPYISVENENGEITGVYGMFFNIDHVKTLKSRMAHDRREIERLSTTDAVTGLLNRGAFEKAAAASLKELFPTGDCFAVCYSDINDFSYVNENFGYEAGDKMLADFADIIMNCGVCVAGCRIYSDYFVSLYRAKDREKLIDKIGERNRKFSEMQKKKYPLSNIQVSCGLYFMRTADEDINTAIDNANLARRSVKGSTDIPGGIYAERMRIKRSHDQAIASEIFNAIKTGAIELFLQPKFNMKTRGLIGSEALARWRNADGSYKLPYEFIDVLENVGYITQLDFYIYEQVLINLAKWKREGRHLYPVSVNFSRKHNIYPNFVSKIAELADRYDVEKSLIEIEVTESCFTQDVKNLFTNMKKLREHGFKIDIDDFGMGYSSLSVLMDAPVDIVKVDKVFIDNIENNEKSREYIDRICNLIQTASKEIIFEGVETEKQAEILCSSGHKMAQGWLFDKAIPVAEFEKKYLSLKSI